MEQHLVNAFSHHIESAIALADVFPAQLCAMGQKMVDCLLAGRKIIVSAPGDAFTNGLYFVQRMLHQSNRERPPLPVVMLGLTPHASSKAMQAHEIHTVANAQDILFILTVAGQYEDIHPVLCVAKEKGLLVCVLNGKDASDVALDLKDIDLVITLPAKTPASMMALQLLAVSGLGEIIEMSLFG